MAGHALSIRLLGGFAVTAEGRPVPESAWRLRRAKSLVKLLALSPERQLHREQIADVLWPDRDSASAANNLRQVLFVARRALEALELPGASEWLAVRDGVIALGADDVEVDVEAFETAAAAAREQPTIAACRHALDLYGGDLLPEDRYEEWAGPRREALRERHLSLLVELAELHEAAGDEVAAIEALQRAVVDDPLHEAAHRGLMRLFAATGRQQQALAQYQQLRQALRRDLAADPDPETRRLHREILAGSVQADEAAPRERVAPERVRPPRPPPGATNLPHRLTTFVGRDRELRELGAMLERTRLLTLVGPGGCGKTRLALELAAGRIADFEDGVWLVELAPIADPELVVAQAATALGMQLRGRRAPEEVLAEQIGERRMLLVLDNCEHVIGASARLVDRLLRVCPALEVLATSREALRVHGEVVWRVPSLSLPDTTVEVDADRLAQIESVRLFCERAVDVAPAFALADGNAGAVAEVCVRLDGMPLAIELAAARTAVLAPAQIAGRLDDSLKLLTAGSRSGLTRQQTLRATLDWSHELLEDDERMLFRRLGAFAGSFGIEAVEGVCSGGEIDAGDALDLLGRLVEKSLVQVEPLRGEHRYRLLETMRQFARERLVEAGELAQAQTRHRAWYVALAEAEDPTPTGANGRPERLEPEHDNIRAALATALDQDPPSALRLAVAVWWFWVTRGYFAEGSRWLDEALARTPERTELRARALAAAALLDVRRGLVHRRIALLEEALDVRREIGDPPSIARGLRELGDQLVQLSAHDPAERAYAEALEASALLDDVGEAAGVRMGQGVLAHYRGDLACSLQRFAECVALLEGSADEPFTPFWGFGIAIVIAPEGVDGALRCFFEATALHARTHGRRAGIAHALCNIALVHRRGADHDAARDALDRALDIFRDIDHVEGVALALHGLGNLARVTGELELGREWLDEALALRREIGNRRDIALTVSSLGLLAVRAGDEARGRALLAEAEAMFARTEDGPGLSGIAQSLGCIELDHGDPDRARELLHMAARMWEEQRVHWNKGWIHTMLAEAAIASGDRELAAGALGVARTDFETLGEAAGLARVAELEARLTRG